MKETLPRFLIQASNSKIEKHRPEKSKSSQNETISIFIQMSCCSLINFCFLNSTYIRMKKKNLKHYIKYKFIR